MSAEQQFTLGVHVKLDDSYWLPVRYVESSTFHEEPTTGDMYIDDEKFVELRNSEGEARFAQVSLVRKPAIRDAGPCRGIKPYFWKGGTING